MRRTSRDECDHRPVLMAYPGHPDWVAVECLICHATTGYTQDAVRAWDAWERGDVAIMRRILEDE